MPNDLSGKLNFYLATSNLASSLSTVVGGCPVRRFRVIEPEHPMREGLLKSPRETDSLYVIDEYTFRPILQAKPDGIYQIINGVPLKTKFAWEDEEVNAIRREVA